MSIGNFPQSLSQQTLVGILLIERLGVQSFPCIIIQLFWVRGCGRCGIGTVHLCIGRVLNVLISQRAQCESLSKLFLEEKTPNGPWKGHFLIFSQKLCEISLSRANTPADIYHVPGGMRKPRQSVVSGTALSRFSLVSCIVCGFPHLQKTVPFGIACYGYLQIPAGSKQTTSCLC